MTTAAPDLASLKLLDERLRFLSAWTIHHANHVRDSVDGLKVGGHQASCASMTAIMAALYFHALGPNDRVAVKPHAGPVLHAIHYLLGSQSLDQLKNFRGYGGMQSYPSRTKDKIPVDFSTGSVGLGGEVGEVLGVVPDILLHLPMFSRLLGDGRMDTVIFLRIKEKGIADTGLVEVPEGIEPAVEQFHRIVLQVIRLILF